MNEPNSISAERELARARAHVEAGEYREALEALECAFIVDPAFDEAYRLTGFIQRLLGNGDLADAFETTAENLDDADALHDLGYRFCDFGHFALAAAFLGRALTLAPGRSDTLYEYGWSLYKSSRFREAITHLERAFARDPDYRTLDLIGNAHALLNEPEAAERTLDEARSAYQARGDAATPDDAVILRESRDLVQRLKFRSPTAAATLRDWHWIQTAGALLHLAPHRGRDGTAAGRYAHCVITPELLARCLRNLAVVCRVQSYTPEVIESLDPGAELPAELLARSCGARSRPGRTDATERSVLYLASSSASLGPHLDAFDAFRPGHVLATLVHDPTRDAEICPDVIGLLARSHESPWAHRSPAASSGRRGAAAARFRSETERHLDSSTDEEREVESIYRELPLALSRDAPGVRPPFAVESPIG